jgi:hypothetical protein
MRVLLALIGLVTSLPVACAPVRSFSEAPDDGGLDGTNDVVEDSANDVSQEVGKDSGETGVESGVEAGDGSSEAGCTAGTADCVGLQVFVCDTAGEWQPERVCADACEDGVCACFLPWGGLLPESESTTAYLNSWEMAPELCSDHAETRTCIDGTLTGSYTNQACDQSYRGCVLASYGSIDHGQGVSSYAAATVPCGETCTQVTISCNDGTLVGGSMYHASCLVDCNCGPYPDLTVTGTDGGGSAWGSNPYTDFSNWGKAAVHAGLLSVGQTGTIKRTNVGFITGFPGSTQNGVTSSNWSSGSCGVFLSH